MTAAATRDQTQQQARSHQRRCNTLHMPYHRHLFCSKQQRKQNKTCYDAQQQYSEAQMGTDRCVKTKRSLHLP